MAGPRAHIESASSKRSDQQLRRQGTGRRFLPGSREGKRFAPRSELQLRGRITQMFARETINFEIGQTGKGVNFLRLCAFDQFRN